MTTTRPTFLILALAYSCVCYAGPDAHLDTPPAHSSLNDVFNFADLVAKSERIVLAEVQGSKAGQVTLLVRELIKGPENDARYVDPDRLKRAAELLNNDKVELPALPAAKKAPALLRLALQNIAAPREGVQALFFLWERAEGYSDREPVYRLTHPQNMYDVELLPQVKAGVSRPRSVSDGRFLRDWDKLMSDRKKQKTANQEIASLKVGEVVLGLRIKAARPVLSLRGNNSFGIAAIIENVRGRDQDVYDGPAGGYGVVIRATGDTAVPGLPLVLRQSTKALGADLAVLNFTDMTDFTTVPRDSSISKELFFDSQDFPILTTIKNDCTVSVFFTSHQSGKGLEIASPVWTGTLVSEELPLRFESPDVNASKR